MEIDNSMHTGVWTQSVQYEKRAALSPEETDGGHTGPQEGGAEEALDMDRIEFEEGDQALAQLRQKYGKGVYRAVEDDPALAWSVGGRTYPSASCVDRSV